MKKIYKMINKIQNYDWGTYDFIANLKGDKISNKPQAELWMGAHPKASSEVIVDGEIISLDKLISQNPNEFLGDFSAKKFAGKLPYLLKILSAKTALSIQVHPDKKQAEIGFEIEEKNGIDLIAFERNYKDKNHKPELIYALTDFYAMCGFRSLEKIHSFWKYNKIWYEQSKGFIENPNSENFQGLFFKLLKLTKNRQSSLVRNIFQNLLPARDSYDENIIYWMKKLVEKYPGDIAVLAPIYMNIIKLKSGESLFLKAGLIHAYLQGSGIEIMANSDNVIRGGLTSKHLDLVELQKILLFDFGDVKVVDIIKDEFSEKYPTSAEEFELVKQTKFPVENTTNSCEILLCTKGEINVEGITIKAGESVFISASVQRYKIIGAGEVFRAGIPEEDL
jgi:mannose-6-phosphate isomerase